jgi:hypothetical protein
MTTKLPEPKITLDLPYPRAVRLQIVIGQTAAAKDPGVEVGWYVDAAAHFLQELEIPDRYLRFGVKTEHLLEAYVHFANHPDELTAAIDNLYPDSVRTDSKTEQDNDDETE